MQDADKPATILVTGFEPFGSYTVNPSAVLAERLDGEMVGGHRVAGVELPVTAARAPEALRAALKRHSPAIVLSLGLAPGRAALALERVAINVLDFGSPDNDALQPQDEPVVTNGPAAYFSTLPLKAIKQAWDEAGLPGYVSNTAGTYVCNQVLYTSLHLASQYGYRAGFIHLPLLPAQVVDMEKHDAPSMTLDLMLEGVRTALTISIQTLTPEEQAHRFEIRVPVG